MKLNLILRNVFFFVVFLIIEIQPAKAQEKTTTDTTLQVENQKKIRSNTEIENDFKKASTLYKEGKIDSTLVVLEFYLQSKIRLFRADKRTRANIYRLAAHANILLDSLTDAEKQVKNMLAFPHHIQESDEDLTLYHYLRDQMFVLPRFMFGVRVGGNYTFPQLSKSFSAFSLSQSLIDNKAERGFYRPQLSFLAGFSLHYSLNRYVAVLAEPIFEKNSFEYQYSLNAGILDYQVSFKQTTNSLKLPLSLRIYPMPRFKFSPYLQAGIFTGVTNASQKKAENSIIDVSDQIRKGNQGFFGGAGFIKHGATTSFAVDARFVRNLNNLAQPQNRFINDNLSDVFIYRFYALPDDLFLQSVEISFHLYLHLNYNVFKK